MIKNIYIILLAMLLFAKLSAQVFVEIPVENVITDVQPMTGIVFWDGDNTNTDAISLEYSYMLFDEVTDLDGDFVWDAVEDKLDDISSRNHQAIFRFRYAYVGKETSVPQYIKNDDTYQETEGISEGETTWFPDWTHYELKDYTMRFYKAFAQKYDNDPRLAFVQVGFGLWGEYHIYDGPFELGVTFPSKAFQEEFFHHLDTTFIYKPWSISIDAADDDYSPFDVNPTLLDKKFGVFDDSFMHEDHAGYNTDNWNFFDRDRYMTSPAGGEFSYYTNYDQQHVLDYPDGPYGKPYEYFANDFHITYMIGNDQPGYQSMDRIKDASFASGYKFQVKSFKASSDSSIIIVSNVGVAPFYYPAFMAVNGVRSSESLQGLIPGEERVFHVSSGGTEPLLTIESDYILESQTIDYYGTMFSSISDDLPMIYIANVYPTILGDDTRMNIEMKNSTEVALKIYNCNGIVVMAEILMDSESKVSFDSLSIGVYYLRLQSKDGVQIVPFVKQ